MKKSEETRKEVLKKRDNFIMNGHSLSKWNLNGIHGAMFNCIKWKEGYLYEHKALEVIENG